jgi:hypothetical protein
MSRDRESNDDETAFFDRAIETLEIYTKKVKKMRNEFALVKKQESQPSVDSRPPAGVRGSVVDTSVIQWRQTLRPYR